MTCYGKDDSKSVNLKITRVFFILSLHAATEEIPSECDSDGRDGGQN